MKNRLMTAIAALSIASCGIYRPYSRPETEAGVYRGTDADTATIASMSWRELFTDPLLQELVGYGLEHSTDLNTALLQTKEAEAVLKNATLSYLPSLGFSPEAGISSYGGTTTKTYSLAVQADWEIDIFGRKTNARRGAKEALEGSRDYAQAVRTQLIATIANSYYTLLMLDRQLEIGQQTMENWDRSIRTLEAMKQAGMTNDAAVLQARANRMQLEASVLTIRRNITETENTLAALIAMPSGEIRRGTLEETVFPEHLSIGIPVQLLANRPNVRKAEHDLAQAFYSTNAARGAFYPSITLSGTLGWTNNGGGIVMNPGRWLLNAIGSLTQPLFSRGTNTANLKIAEARQEAAVLRFQQSILDAGKEVNNALVQWQTARQRIIIGVQQTDALKEAVRKTEVLMQHSSTSYLEVLTAQQSLLSAEQTQAQDRFDEIQGIISLYHALGGGCE